MTAERTLVARTVQDPYASSVAAYDPVAILDASSLAHLCLGWDIRYVAAEVPCAEGSHVQDLTSTSASVDCCRAVPCLVAIPYKAHRKAVEPSQALPFDRSEG